MRVLRSYRESSYIYYVVYKCFAANKFVSALHTYTVQTNTLMYPVFAYEKHTRKLLYDLLGYFEKLGTRRMKLKSVV